MKTRKNFFTGLFAIALLVAATVGALESNKSEIALNELAMANVEALANGEIHIGVPCMNTNRYLCVYLGPGPNDYLEIVGEVYS